MQSELRKKYLHLVLLPQILMKDVGEIRCDFSGENETHVIGVNSPAVISFQETVENILSVYTSEFLLEL